MGLNIGKLAGGAVSGIPIVGDILGGIAGLFGGGKPNHATDPRWIENNSNYVKALNGDANALRILKARAGLGVETVNGVTYGTHKDGVGDLTADAKAKYFAVQTTAAQGGGGAATALGPASSATPAGAAFDALSAPTFAGLPLWAVLGAAGAVGYLLLKRR